MSHSKLSPSLLVKVSHLQCIFSLSNANRSKTHIDNRTRSVTSVRDNSLSWSKCLIYFEQTLTTMETWHKVWQVSPPGQSALRTHWQHWKHDAKRDNPSRQTTLSPGQSALSPLSTHWQHWQHDKKLRQSINGSLQVKVSPVQCVFASNNRLKTQITEKHEESSLKIP